MPGRHDFNPRTREGCDPSILDPRVPGRHDFNPRTREGCDRLNGDDSHCQHRISIHAPVKGATVRICQFQRTAFGISIHAPVKGATVLVDKREPIPLISIHAPVKGATCVSVSVCTSFQHFNPRTREGCDNDAMKKANDMRLISIHAPVKGATNRRRNDTGIIQYFNPRTREGCDLQNRRTLWFTMAFQSTHP